MNKTIFQREDELFFHTYRRLPLELDYGEGVYLYTKDGRRLVDFFGGLAVNALGYCHPKIVRAIEKQIRRYNHVSNYFIQDTQVELAERILCASQGMKKIFFTNSGTEAVEGAIKLARKWGKENNKVDLFCLTNSFHGRTMGALSLTERPKYRDGFDPFLPNTGYITFNCVPDLLSKVTERTLGVILECIQGEGGINIVSQEFARALKELRERYGFLIIVDEIQSGIGRTGKFYSYEYLELEPDIVVIAKAIGGGLPLGALLGNDRVAECFAYGAHGTTFGGNPVACAAGCAVMEEVVDNKLMEQAGAIGLYILTCASELKEKFPTLIKEVRGRGCMIGIDLTIEGQSIVDTLLERGFLVNCTNTTVIRFLPPYIIEKEHCDALFTELNDILRAKAEWH
ncbi:MAG: acetylornithine/succinylornithine family transaminase [Bacteroidetes bacterium]|nr:acetylornithine/succinylornithine family transaminase [Bacteroidota bacterium]